MVFRQDDHLIFHEGDPLNCLEAEAEPLICLEVDSLSSLDVDYLTLLELCLTKILEADLGALFEAGYPLWNELVPQTDYHCQEDKHPPCRPPRRAALLAAGRWWILRQLF